MAYVYPGAKVDLGAGRGWLNTPAAASIRRIDRQIGHAMQITEAGRDWAQQNKHYQHYLRYGSPIALNPDTPSIHQKGAAIDTDEGQQFNARMEENGWKRTVYRYVNGKWTLVEPWHYEYFPENDRHINDGGETPASEMEDDMIRIQAPGRGIALIGPGYYRPLGNDEEVNNSGPIISKHASGNDRQFDLWVSMALAGQASGATAEMIAKAVWDFKLDPKLPGSAQAYLNQNNEILLGFRANGVPVKVDTKAIVDGVLAGLPEGTLSKADVADAVRQGLNELILRADQK